MQKKYIVRLTDQERAVLVDVVKRLKGTSQKVRRAQMLLKADADGPARTDKQIAEAFSCRIKRVENVRQRLVQQGFEETLYGKKRAEPPTENLLDGEQEAKIIATRLSPPPKGYANWTLRLLARKVVELEMASILEGRYADCEKVIVVCDNLNTHTKGACYEAFESARARQLVRRIEFCYTPKHGSWLNVAENELSSMTRQCVAGRRMGDIETLRSETTAWSSDVNASQSGIDWQMQIDDARCKLKSV